MLATAPPDPRMQPTGCGQLKRKERTIDAVQGERKWHEPGGVYSRAVSSSSAVMERRFVRRGLRACS
jgi:hypothetical protein